MGRAQLEAALRDSGGDLAHTRRLRALLAAELDRSRAELAKPRSGYNEPVTVAFAAGIVAVAPVASAYRVDPRALGDRERQLASILEAALSEATDGAVLRAGDHEGHLALAAGGDHELAALAFDEAVAGVDRLRARSVLVPVLDPSDLRPFARAAVDDTIRPHDDPDPARRVARRILQTLDRKGKWGGYHTDFAHLQRGFEGNDRQLATTVGEALLAAGLLAEKPSVGQRHVYLNSRRARDIHRLIEDGQLPNGLVL
ncbi:MAG: hypothetical protein WKF94_11445 [Solirubrobacteraceae bacterium]